MAHEYEARVTWSRGDANFLDNKYSRRHEWRFDSGVTVPGTSSPAVVPLPYSAADAVDPEEALVASASSCHMLWFLALAGKRGFVVDRYEDEAVGTMAKNAQGRIAFDRIVLRPRISFSGDKQPTAADLDALHHRAHEECYIANTLRCEIAIEPRSA